VEAKRTIIDMSGDKSSGFDWLLALATGFLILAGLLSIYSATFNFSGTAFLKRQAISAVVGLVAFGFAIFIPMRVYKSLAYPIYAISVLALIAVLLVGDEINGTKGWIRLGGFSFQPAELAKLGVLLGVARYVSTRGKDVRTWRDLGSTLLFLLPPIVLIFRQPDVGSATVLFALYVGLLFWAGFDAFILYFFACLPILLFASLKSTELFIIMAVIFSILAFFFRKSLQITIPAVIIFGVMGFFGNLVYSGLMPHQKLRIDIFLNPGTDPRGAGYNVWQSLLAVGSGGFTGKGYMQGTLTQLRYIPEQWTDFIYSVPNEEFGFIGGAFIIFALAVVILRSARIAFDTDKKFQSMVAMGAAIIFLYHTVINIGMVIGVVPVMGIPLPFLSYGGTALIFNMILIGLVLNIARTYHISKSAAYK